jgi:hypothetical protein
MYVLASVLVSGQLMRADTWKSARNQRGNDLGGRGAPRTRRSGVTGRARSSCDCATTQGRWSQGLGSVWAMAWYRRPMRGVSRSAVRGTGRHRCNSRPNRWSAPRRWLLSEQPSRSLPHARAAGEAASDTVDCDVGVDAGSRDPRRNLTWPSWMMQVPRRALSTAWCRALATAMRPKTRPPTIATPSSSPAGR